MFTDRQDAGRRLARQLEHHRGTDAVVLGLPRGGVVVAAEVARHLALPLDVIVVRKLGVPWQPEVAMGAIGEGGARVLDRALMARAGISEAQLAAVERREAESLAIRLERLRRGRRGEDLTGRTAIVVDDGVATGATARAACSVARDRGAMWVVLAVPVAPPGTAVPEADELVCVETPSPFLAVGNHYRSFPQTEDHEVTELLDAAARGTAPPAP